jgi:predicted SprT family Zn-dependent metalloprotease
VSIDAHAILAQVKRNQALLDSCQQHAFTPTQMQHGFVRRYMCSHCQGEVDSHGFHWYSKGLAHAAAAQT